MQQRRYVGPLLPAGACGAGALWTSSGFSSVRASTEVFPGAGSGSAAGGVVEVELALEGPIDAGALSAKEAAAGEE